VFTVGQNSAFTVGKIWCSHFVKISVHSWQKYAVRAIQNMTKPDQIKILGYIKGKRGEIAHDELVKKIATQPYKRKRLGNPVTSPCYTHLTF